MALHFSDNVHRNVVLIVILELIKEVFFTHKLLSGVPPIILELFRIFLLGSPLNFTIAHDTDSMHDHFDVVRGCVEHLDLIDV